MLGGDVKAKLWTSENAYLLLQGEYLHLDRDDAGWDPSAVAYTNTGNTDDGGYAFADFNWKQRYNVGASPANSPPGRSECRRAPPCARPPWVGRSEPTAHRKPVEPGEEVGAWMLWEAGG